ncbi:MAG: hypothetical protein HYZ45_01825, partial [Burkholderiales bacterium]|nr:hypothetical protein [Burkholderiales bacterium]
EYANGGRYVLERGQVMSNGQDTKHDRVTWSAYDSHNNVKAILDAEGHLSRTDFDAFGRAVRLRQVVSNSFFGTQEERVQVLQYDALGRQIDDATRAVAHTLDANEVRHFVHQRVSYNSFGEITGRNLVLTDSKTGIVLSNTSYEINRYDNAGNVIQTNQGDGVTKTLHYDVMGRVTAAIRNTNNADANGANSADFALCFATHR